MRNARNSMTSIQFFKLLILFSVSSLFAFVGISTNKSHLIPPIEYLDAISPYIFGFTATTVFFLLKYMDSISTSTSLVKTEQNKTKVRNVQKSFLKLNQESIANVILSLSLFIIAKLVKIPDLKVELSSFCTEIVFT